MPASLRLRPLPDALSITPPASIIIDVDGTITAKHCDNQQITHHFGAVVKGSTQTRTVSPVSIKRLNAPEWPSYELHSPAAIFARANLV